MVINLKFFILKKVFFTVAFLFLTATQFGFSSNLDSKDDDLFFSCDRVVIFMRGDDYVWSYVLPFPDGSSSCGVFITQLLDVPAG